MTEETIVEELENLEEIAEIEEDNENEASENLETQNEEVEKSNELFTIRDLLEAGVHFGHRTMRWNAKMAPYIYGIRNNIHIIDLTQTAILLNEATRILREVARKKGKILFVCTKKQGAQSIKELAENNNQFYVNHKWLGGMLTNWKVISQSIRKMKNIESQLTNENNKLLKKELVVLNKEKQKLEDNLTGIKTMGTLPDLLFVIDTVKESLAINEARSLGIPVMAVIDTNSNPDVVDYPIPGNDDSIKSIQLYCKVINEALKDIKINRTEKKEFNKPNLKKKTVKKGVKDPKKVVKKPNIKKAADKKVEENKAENKTEEVKE